MNFFFPYYFLGEVGCNHDCRHRDKDCRLSFLRFTEVCLSSLSKSRFKKQ